MASTKKESNKTKASKMQPINIFADSSTNNGTSNGMLQQGLHMALQSTLTVIKSATGLSSLAIITKAIKIILKKLHELHSDKVKQMLLILGAARLAACG